MGGGKSGTSQSTVSIPPEVLARYNAVNATAENVAKQPFQAYSTDPNAFVAPVNPVQASGINTIYNAQNAAQPWYGAAGQAYAQGAQAAQPFTDLSAANVQGAQQSGAAFNQAAANLYGGAQAAASPFIQGATSATGQALSSGVPLTQQAYNQGAGLTQQGLGQIGGIVGQGQNYINAANGNLAAGQNAANPLLQNAAMAYQGGLGAAMPFDLAGAQAVNAQQIGGRQINQFMNPYMNQVIGGTLAPLQQQQAMDRQSQLSNQIRSGAFGGNRAAISSDVLKGQQDIATGNVVGNLLNQGYGQALSAAEQQQGVNLAAQQANRAALQQTGQNIYGQMTGTGQQQAALGNQLFGMGNTAAGTLASLGQQGYQQGMGGVQQGLAGAQQLYNMGAGAGQQLYNQYSGTGQQLGNLGQQVFGQQTGVAQGLGNIGQQQFGQGMTAAQQQAALANQLFGQGVTGAQTLGSLGTGAQNAAISGGQAALAAGTVPQQTQQAGLSALYNQFQQQQGYPFQVAQFLANIAEGTGALSGSTTTTTQPTSFFSDERLKEDIEPIGETYDGQKIIKFRYKGEKGPKQIGLVAQDVEKHHPDAVGESHGYKTVDYDKATREAAHRGHFYKGGLVPSSEGGVVHMGHAGEGFAGGGSTSSIVDAQDLNALLGAHQQMYAGFNPAGLYGGASPAGQKGGIVPAASLAVPKLVTASNVAPQNQATLGSTLHGAVQTGSDITNAYGMGKSALFGSPATKDSAATKGVFGDAGSSDKGGYLSDAKKALGFTDSAARGGVIPFHRGTGGELPYGEDQDETKGYMGTISYERKSPQELKNEQDAQRQGKLPQQSQSGLGSAIGAAKDIYGAGKLGKSALEGAKGLMGADKIGSATMSGVTDAAQVGPFMSEAPAGIAGAIVPAEAAVAAPAAEAAGGAGLLGGLGSAIGSVGESIASFLPFLLKDGGVVPREHHAGPDSTNGQSNVVGDGGGGGDDGTVDTGRVSPKDLYDHLVSQGADPRTALVLTSGAASESGFNPTAKHDYDENGVAQGYGLFGHQGPRLDAMRQQTGTQYPNWKQQASFALSEMQDPRYQKMIAAANSPEDLTKVQMHFERPKGYTPDNPEAGHNYTGRVADTNALMPLVLGQDINWGATTKAAAAGRPSQGGLGGAGSAGTSTGGGGLLDTLTSEKFLIPLASGLAGMASSPSRYLGAAVLQGLGAGAQSYQQMKQQESAIQKQQADIQREREQSQIGFGQLAVQQQQANIARTAKVAELMQQLRTLNATRQIAGLDPLDTTEFFKSMGAGDLVKDVTMAPKQAGVGAPAQQPAQAAAAGQPAQAGAAPAQTAVETAKSVTGAPAPSTATVTTQATQGVPKPGDDFWKGVDPQDNLHTLAKNYQVAMAGNLPQVGQQILADINRVKSSGMVMKDGQMVPIPGFAEAEAAKKAMIAKSEAEVKEPFETKKMATEKMYTTQNAARTAAAKEADNANDIISQTNAMKDLMFDRETGKPLLNTGPMGEKINQYAAYFKQAGFSDNFIKTLANTDPSNADSLRKMQTTAGTELARMELNGSPVRVSEFNRFLQSTPGEQMLPGAFKWIIENVLQPKAMAQQKVYERVMDMDPAKDNIEKEIYLARKENPWYRYNPPAPQQQAAPALSPDQAREELQRRRSQGVQ